MAECRNNTEVVTEFRQKFLKFDAAGEIELNASDWKGKYVIYMIINLETGMKYVGKTIDLLNRANNYILNYRKENEVGISQPIIRDMRRLGIEKFRMFPIATAKSRRTLAEAEKFYTEQFGTYWPKGYNVATVSDTAYKSLKGTRKHPHIGHPHAISTKMKKAKLVACINPDTLEMYVSVGMKLFGDLIGKSKDIVKNAAKAPIRISGFYIIYLSKVDRDEIVHKVQERVNMFSTYKTQRGVAKSNHHTYYGIVSDVETMLIEESAEVFENNGYTCNFLTYNETNPENGLSYEIQPISEFINIICPPDEDSASTT